MTLPLVIIGAGGFGREALDVADAQNADHPTWDFVGFAADGGGDLEVLAARGLPFLGGTAEFLDALDAAVRRHLHYVIAIGTGAARRAIAAKMDATGARLVHPAATIGAACTIGPGAVITAGARLTTSVHLGEHAHVNLNATIGHDCRIGDYVTLSPGAHVSGRVTLGDEVLLGTGSVINPNVTVGARATVGSGAVVVKDVPEGDTVVGIPAVSRR